MWRLPTPEFKVLLYGPGLPPAGIKARAHFEPGILVVQGKGHWFTVQSQSIALKTGGYDGRQWLISWHSPSGPMTAMLQGEDTVDIFIKHAPAEISPELKRVRKAHARHGWLFRLGMSMLAFFLLAPLIALGVFWIYADNLSQWAAEKISIEQEIRMGDLAFAQMKPSLKLVDDGAALEAVELIGVRLTAGGQNYRYRFHTALDPQMNAFALPGGHVVVFTGLLGNAESAEELAGVLAHEISHVELRHTLRNMIHGLGWRAVLGIVLGDFSGGIWGGMARELGGLSYSRDLEREADFEGAQLLRRTGVPAGDMVHLYERMAKMNGSPPAMLSTHPTGLERMTVLRETIASLGDYPSQPLGIDWNRVKRDLARRNVK